MVHARKLISIFCVQIRLLSVDVDVVIVEDLLSRGVAFIYKIIIIILQEKTFILFVEVVEFPHLLHDELYSFLS